MENFFYNSSENNELSFSYSSFNKINSNKYTLYDVMINPELDKLSFSNRFEVLNSYQEDVILNNNANYLRYSTEGCKNTRTVFDPSSRKLFKMLNLGSNDYLNMSQHPDVINTAIDTIKKYGTGAGAACNASGLTNVKIDLENEIAGTFGKEKALVYPTGFMTNTGVLNALLRKNDIAIVDMLAHASIMDGVAARNKMLFKHNDMRSLEAVLRRVNRQYTGKIIVVDGVYSMDGDIANLPEISDLAKKYGALVMVDEAHAFGVIGSKGLGILDYFDMQPDSIDILTGTLSKAIGSQGGFVAGNKEMINYLILASRPYFFTTAPFVAANAAACKSIQIIKEDINRRKKLWENIRYFKQKLKKGKFDIGNAQTAIFPVILGDHNKVLKVTNKMGINGVLVNGIPYPAVSRKQTRIRMSLTAEMTREQLDKGYDVLVKSIQEYDKKKDMKPNTPTYIPVASKRKIHETAGL